MNKEFVPYQESLELKELGFDEPCLAFYPNPLYDKLTISRSGPILQKDLLSKNECTAPLYQQAFRWFRENHNIFSSPTNNTASNTYDFIIESPSSFTFIGYKNTYEEAELAALRKLIEIVKTKTND